MPPQLFSPIIPEEKRKLLSLMLVAAKQHGFVAQDDMDIHGDRLLNLYRQWGGDKWAANFKPFGLEMHVEEAAANFSEWCKEKVSGDERKLESREVHLTEMSVTFVIPLGQRGEIQFGLKALPPRDADAEELKDNFQKLLQQSILGYENFLDNPPVLPVKKSYHAKSGDTTKVLEFTSILCKTSGTNRSYFMKGGEFVKYGIRVWPNVLSAAGIDPLTIEGEKFIAGKAVYTLKATGDPDLVIGITVGGNNL